jgi:hypothetical protein
MEREKAGNSNRKPNYIQLGKQQLVELFPGVADYEITQVYKSNSHDMARTITEVC